MVPGWKIAREARRLREQAKAFFLRPLYEWRQRKHDANRDNRTRISTGNLPLGADVVVLLVYQPKGLAGSIFHTLDNIRAQGMSAMVVMNAPVSDADLGQLRAHAALIMERPNFGYDFGGYRDAVLYLTRQGLDLTSITCLNDSVWFPVFAECDHLARMRAIDAQLVGYAYAKGLRNRKNAHVQSYFFMFRGVDFLKSSDFVSFWRDLRVSDSRYFTIRNSEMQMTRYFADRGHQIGWLFSADDMEAIYRSCDARNLDLTRNYLQAIGHRLSPSLAQATDPEALRALILDAFADGTLSRNVIGFEPVTLYQHARFGAMKKAMTQNYILHRRQALRDGVVDSFAPAVAAEIRARD
ncbi:MAG: rhamnan synthesis F family protein [Roseinatronobacter sp.]